MLQAKQRLEVWHGVVGLDRFQQCDSDDARRSYYVPVCKAE